MTDKIQIRAMGSPWYRCVELLFKQGKAYGTSVTFEVKNEFIQPDPTVRIDYDEAQVLMDDLWNAGLRPTEGSGSAGAMRRAELHIEDLRKIAFKVLKVE